MHLRSVAGGLLDVRLDTQTLRLTQANRAPDATTRAALHRGRAFGILNRNCRAHFPTLFIEACCRRSTPPACPCNTRPLVAPPAPLWPPIPTPSPPERPPSLARAGKRHPPLRLAATALRSSSPAPASPAWGVAGGDLRITSRCGNGIAMPAARNASSIGQQADAGGRGGEHG